jgi:hypothetical protein
MEDKARRHLHILDDLILYQPDRSKQLLGGIQCEDTPLFSETKQNTNVLLKAWLASSVPLEVSPNLFSWVAQMMATNASTQTTKSSSRDKIVSSPQDKSIRTLIAFADRRTNKDYRVRLERKLESISKYICTLARTWQDVLEDRWQDGDHLERSRLILLLLDDNFLNTDYCTCSRLKNAVERHNQGKTYVMPIYLRPCIINDKLPFYNLPFHPSKTQAVSQHNNKDTAFENISKEIKIAVEYIRDNILPITDQ